MDPMVMKRSQLYGMTSNPYSQQQGAPYGGQHYASPHRFPLGASGRGQLGGTFAQHQVSKLVGYKPFCVSLETSRECLSVVRFSV